LNTCTVESCLTTLDAEIETFSFPSTIAASDATSSTSSTSQDSQLERAMVILALLHDIRVYSVVSSLWVLYTVGVGASKFSVQGFRDGLEVLAFKASTQLSYCCLYQFPQVLIVCIVPKVAPMLTARRGIVGSRNKELTRPLVGR
jgi:hypothetical protein